MAAFLASLGGRLGKQLPAILRPYLLISLFILLAALYIFRTVSRLNLALFLALSFSSGLVVTQFIPLTSYRGAWFTLTAGILLSCLLGFWWRGRLLWGPKLFLPLIMLYALGWPLVAFLNWGTWVIPTWSSLGLLLFGLLAVWLLSEARHALPEDYVPLASDLFIAYFNIFLIGSLLPGGLA